jgi:hypothetical protein
VQAGAPARGYLDGDGRFFSSGFSAWSGRTIEALIETAPPIRSEASDTTRKPMLVNTDHIATIGDGLNFDAKTETDTIVPGVLVFSLQENAVFSNGFCQ